MSNSEVPQKRPFLERFLLYIWTPISVTLTAIDLISIQENFWPALIKWSEYFKQYWQLFRELRDFLLWPLIKFLTWFDFELSEYWRSHLMLGGIIASHFILSGRVNNRIPIEGEGKKVLYKPKHKKSYFLDVLILIAMGPFAILFLISEYRDVSKDKMEPDYSKLFGDDMDEVSMDLVIQMSKGLKIQRYNTVRSWFFILIATFVIIGLFAFANYFIITSK